MIAAAEVPATTPEYVAAWEDAPRPASGDAPVLSVEGFQGPLDRLLDMARARKIDLAGLSIAALIEAFATAMRAALAEDGARIERWAAWTVMAAGLAELWSRLMLPADSPQARAALAEAEALRRALADRARTRAAADWLERRPQLGRDAFPRGAPEVPAGRRFGDLTDLLRACLVALRVPEQEAVASRSMPPRFWTTAEALGRIRQMLAENPEGAAFRVFPPPVAAGPARDLRCRAAIASTLLAALELARTGDAVLEQERGFAMIRIRAIPAALAPVAVPAKAARRA
jgi:segregation and condensation protein A